MSYIHFKTTSAVFFKLEIPPQFEGEVLLQQVAAAWGSDQAEFSTSNLGEKKIPHFDEHVLKKWGLKTATRMMLIYVDALRLFDNLMKCVQGFTSS